MLKLFFWTITNFGTDHEISIQVRYLIFVVTVMSPNSLQPLTLCISPRDYATFNQIKSFLIFDIGLLLEREKQQKVFTLSFNCLAGVDICNISDLNFN